MTTSAAAMPVAEAEFCDAYLRLGEEFDAPVLFTTMPPGFTFVAVHFNAPGDVEVIEPNSAQIGIAEYELFSDLAFGEMLFALDIEFMGFRELRNARRAGRG